MTHKETQPDTVENQLQLKNILKIGIPVFILAAYVKYLMNTYQVERTEPPEELQNGEKNSVRFLTELMTF